MAQPHTRPQRILIIRLSAHGDVVQTLPLLGLLRKQHPNATIGWVVEASAAPLLKNHPMINHLHVSYRKQWLATFMRSPWKVRTIWREFNAFIQDIKIIQYDLSYDVQGLFKSAVIGWFSGIPKRIGYQNTRELGDLFYTNTLTHHNLTDPNLPTVIKFAEGLVHITGDTPLERRQELSTSLPYPTPPPSPESTERLTPLLNQLNSKVPTVVLAPSTVWPSKQWPINYWKHLLISLLDAPLNIVCIGTDADRVTFKEMMPSVASPKVFNWMGHTRIDDLYLLFKHSDMLIGQDSAPLHIANAIASEHPDSRPRILGLFGPTGPQRTGPIGSTYHQTITTNLPCQPCFKRTCPLPKLEKLTQNEKKRQKESKANTNHMNTDHINIDHMACQNTLHPEAVVQRVRAMIADLPRIQGQHTPEVPS